MSDDNDSAKPQERFEKPILTQFPAEQLCEEVTVSLSKLGDGLTVRIPYPNKISVTSSCRLVLESETHPGWEDTHAEAMGVYDKDPETHPDDFDVPSPRKDVLMSVSNDVLKAYVGTSVKLRYRCSNESYDPDNSKPITLKIVP